MKGFRRSRPGAVACLLTALVASAANPLAAQANRQPRPIIREWTCENGRTVQVNYHPRRIREPAWLTYLGNRVEIVRKRVDAGIAASSADGRVSWHETGSEAKLEFVGLLDRPLHCESKSGK